jgi:hypothetical protein
LQLQTGGGPRVQTLTSPGRQNPVAAFAANAGLPAKVISAAINGTAVRTIDMTISPVEQLHALRLVRNRQAFRAPAHTGLAVSWEKADDTLVTAGVP